MNVMLTPIPVCPALRPLHCFSSPHQRFHRSLPPTPVYAFGRSAASASVPGPTILAACLVPVVVRWVNASTDTKHLLPIDPTLGVPAVASAQVPLGGWVGGSLALSLYLVAP